MFPSLMPPTTNSLWFDTDIPCDEENEVQSLENEHQNWLNSISQTACDLNPIGGPFTETLDNDTDDEDQDANDDDSADSDSHDEEEDEIEGNDRIIIESSDARDDDPMPVLMNND